ncbi:uncharacterized protein A4U43_C08F1870 [Asparagus officinalis]|nr:uncharacterized protein A4U43_C08F1870 [Asparagus officinalis]
MFEKVVTPARRRQAQPPRHPEAARRALLPAATPPPTTPRAGSSSTSRRAPPADRGGSAYSYWNSSQSYVMTKGWSRFVKDKRLDGGDTVSFSRAVANSNRLFIDWRRARRLWSRARWSPRGPPRGRP